MSLLLVEDNEVDVLSIRRSMKKSKLDNPLVVARDGIEALERLRGTNGQDPLPEPRLVLLDLNLPRMNGHEFLAEIRSDSKLRKTVVFVLSTSSDERDRDAAYDRNVAGYIVKKSTDAQLGARLVEMLRTYCDLVDFPEGRS